MGRILAFNQAVFYEEQRDTRRICRRKYDDAKKWLDYIELAYDWIDKCVAIDKLDAKVFDSLQDSNKYYPSVFSFFVAPDDKTLVFMITDPKYGIRLNRVLNAAELREKYPRQYAQYVKNGIREFVSVEAPLKYSELFG